MATILTVDDNIEMLETLEKILTYYNFDVLTAENGKIALKIARKEKPDLVLLDAYMPVMDGFNTCKELKTHQKTKHIPVVFLSAKYTTTKYQLEGIKLGADDYILKPFNAKELVARIRSILKKTEAIQTLKNKNIEIIRTRAKESATTTMTDSLTGLPDREAFKIKLENAFNSAKRYEKSVSLILIEIDNFEHFKEFMGNKLADYILMKSANIILNSIKNYGRIFRFDEEKFAVIINDADQQTGFFEAEKIRIALEKIEYMDESELEIRDVRSRMPSRDVTASIGLAVYSAATEIKTKKKLLENAISALDQAKRSGRNKTFSFEKI